MTEWVGSIDGGASKTAGALADRAGGVRLLAQAAGCNPQDNRDWPVFPKLRRMTPGFAPWWRNTAPHSP